MRTSTRLLSLIFVFIITACADDDNNGRIVIGSGFEIFVLNELQYQAPFVIQVTDITGGAGAGEVVTINLEPTRYRKGFYSATDIDVPPNGVTDEWQVTTTVICNNEDANLNGILDAGEDNDPTNGNNNGVLDPANAATISAHPDQIPTITPGTNKITTDNTGFGYFSLVYPKSQGSWVEMKLTVTVGDGSPGNTQSDTFFLPVLLADLDDTAITPPGGTIGAYGTAATCTDQN